MISKRKVLALLGVCVALVQLYSQDEYGLRVSGGVKTGIMVKNVEYGGKLGNTALGPEYKYPMTLFFASYENEAHNGEGWISLGYSWFAEGIGAFGLQLGLWAHGDIKSYNDILHLGDHYVWANFFDSRLRLIGGQGGGAPINSGGWINADWLSYTGLRVFWVDPIGLSAGINFPNPGADGIKPVNYLSLLAAGIAYSNKDWSASLQFDNSPIYDDSESNYYGGLHRREDQDPIAMAGNIAVGAGVKNLYGGKGFLALEGLFTNLGEDEEQGRGDYTISPVQTAFALKTGYPVTDAVYAEIKAKYTISKGDADDFINAKAPATWGKLEAEPYVSFQAFPNVGFNLSVNTAFYFNSYYLALGEDHSRIHGFTAGQVPGYGPLLDYLSSYYVTVKPGVLFKVGGAELALGYSGAFSREHVENTMYLDLKWSF